MNRVTIATTVALALALNPALVRSADAPPVAAIKKLQLSADLQPDADSFEKALRLGLFRAGFATTGKVTYFLTATLKSDAHTYSLRVSLENINSHETSNESLDCGANDPCPPMPMALTQAARMAATKALRQAKERANLIETAPNISAAPLPAPPPQIDSLAFAPSSNPTPPAYNWRRPVGWTALAVGVALLAYGSYAFYLDGRGTDCFVTPSGNHGCFREYTTMPFAVVGAVLGAVAGGTGTFLLWQGSPQLRD